MLWTSTAASSSPSLRPPVDLLYGVSAFTIEPAARIRPDRWPRKCSPGQDRHLPISTVRLIPRREPGQWGSGPQLMPVVERIGVKGPDMVIRAHPRLPPQLSLPVKAPVSSTAFRRSRSSGPTVGDEAAEEIGLRASTRRCASAGTRSSARSKSARCPRSACGPGRGSVRFQDVGPFGQARRDVVPTRAVQPQGSASPSASVPARPAVAEVRAGTPDSVSAPAGSSVSLVRAQLPQHGEDCIRVGEGQLPGEVVLVIAVATEAMPRDGLSDGGGSRGQPGDGADGRYLGATTNPGLP